MLDGTVFLITDRPDNSDILRGELSLVADCKVIRFDAVLDITQKPIGVVSDVTLDRREAASAMRRAFAELKTADVPVICLLRNMGEISLRDAKNLGATCCLSALTTPAMIARTVMAQVIQDRAERPTRSIERGVARATEVLTRLFDGVRSNDQISLTHIDASLDPIISAVREGGLTRWLDRVWTHDDATYQHCLLVAGVAAKFSLHLGFSTDDRNHFVRAALLHDLGKARIPLSILNKPGRLDEGETTIMRTHPVIGYEKLKAAGCDLLTLGAVRHHHEMLDGTGYPDGLSGNSIGDTVRLMTICDIYSALTEKRAYKPAMPTSVAMAILSDMTGRLEGGLVQSFGEAMATAS
ncbi:HD domain-containing phosphohydrolase [Methylobacterium sp. 77]|uniref:HD-GYP domain-containing protein n=1 Tax=Methylobacterium sp. 77 TaxID=1101192 RepID=UPI0003811234|nr:HD domain-containing phosphohydrolase [Methylobacterium sp. 77]